MIPPHLFYQIYLSFLEQNGCTPPKCGELSEYTDSAHTEVEDAYRKEVNFKCLFCFFIFSPFAFLTVIQSAFPAITREDASFW